MRTFLYNLLCLSLGLYDVRSVPYVSHGSSCSLHRATSGCQPSFALPVNCVRNISRPHELYKVSPCLAKSKERRLDEAQGGLWTSEVTLHVMSRSQAFGWMRDDPPLKFQSMSSTLALNSFRLLLHRLPLRHLHNVGCSKDDTRHHRRCCLGHCCLRSPAAEKRSSCTFMGTSSLTDF